MEDAIFEEPRNVSIKLHRRAAKHVKVRLFFAARWIMISEVSFDSSPARGNYTEEEAIDRGDKEEEDAPGVIYADVVGKGIEEDKGAEEGEDKVNTVCIHFLGL